MKRLIATMLAAAVSACALEAPTTRLALPESAGGVWPPGTLRGQVWALEGDRFVPAPGATVRVVGTERRVTADDRGGFQFDGLSPGRWRVEAERPGWRGEGVECRLPAAFGVDRVPLALAPVADEGAPSGAVRLVGTLTDPRGAGLGAGTVHVVDSAGGNRRWTADAAGCFWGLVPGGAGGAASLMGYGVTPGGLPMEGRTVQAIALGDGPYRPVAVTTEVAARFGEPRLVESSGGALTWTAERLPSRRDELAIRLPCAGDLAPSAIEGDRLEVPAPAGCERPDAGARLLPLGLD